LGLELVGLLALLVDRLRADPRGSEQRAECGGAERDGDEGAQSASCRVRCRHQLFWVRGISLAKARGPCANWASGLGATLDKPPIRCQPCRSGAFVQVTAGFPQ